MSQIEYYTAERRTWWERLFSPRVGGAEENMDYQLPADSLFASTWNGANSIADVPENIKAQIREEAILDAFNRLAASLRLLLYATTPEKEPPTAERCHQILNVWRYELEHEINLTPDTYCGAVQRYEPAMDASYTIDGRCRQGDLLRIRVPCWRMYSRVVIRGEAELIEPDGVREADASEDAQMAAMAAEAISAPASEANGHGSIVPGLANGTAPHAVEMAPAAEAADRTLEMSAAEVHDPPAAA